MFPSPRSLIIPLVDDELAVTVDGEDAVLALGPAGRARDPGPDDHPSGESGQSTDSEPAGLRLRVPARALVAAVRVAWADEHDRGRLEPWRAHGPAVRPSSAYPSSGRSAYDRPAYDRPGYDRHDYGYDAEYDRWADDVDDGYARYGHVDHGWDDDLGDGDAGGFRDPTVVPFPYRPTPTPTPTPTPARSGALWEPDEHRTLREMWFAAPPDADKNELVRDIATRLERGIGGVSARLRVAGCDPTRPGSAWDGSWAPDGPEPEAEPESAPVPLDGSG